MTPLSGDFPPRLWIYGGNAWVTLLTCGVVPVGLTAP